MNADEYAKLSEDDKKAVLDKKVSMPYVVTVGTKVDRGNLSKFIWAFNCIPASSATLKGFLDAE